MAEEQQDELNSPNSQITFVSKKLLDTFNEIIGQYNYSMGIIMVSISRFSATVLARASQQFVSVGDLSLDEIKDNVRDDFMNLLSTDFYAAIDMIKDHSNYN